MTFGIVGLGLMGGSFAKALKKYKLSSQILGYDLSLQNQKDAMSLGLVDKIINIEDLSNCDVIILAIPVDAIISFFPYLKNINSNTTIIDFGSTKELIVKNIPKSLKSNYIPAHPMTGTEKFGPKAAIDDLFENKTMVLCDLENTNDIHKNRAIEIFSTINMKLTFMDSSMHDVHACYISHLPHALSFSLANAVMSHENPEDIISLAAGGFRDMSRIAKSSPYMWGDIFRQNKKNLLESISLYEEQLKNLKEMLEDDNHDEIQTWIKKANTLHKII